LRLKSSLGFTLLEVIIAMMIMAFLSLFTVQAIQRALKTKAKVQKEIDKNSTLRDALRIMERDINMAFNYRDISIELHNKTQEMRKAKVTKPLTKNQGESDADFQTRTQQQQQDAANSAEKYKLKVEKIATQFIGENEELNFTSLSNVRVSDEQKISSQAEIGYKIKSCRRRSTQEQSSKCLWRRVSNYIHEDITKVGEETVLLENIAEFKLRYLGPGKDDEWQDQWISSDKGGDDTTKNKFPYAVEITMAVKETVGSANTPDKLLRMTAVAAIRNPNNKKEEKPDGQVGIGTSPGG
jgi:prepilin-type N-terminal cleavage/methylation domain-containing protein